ncbi:MAG: cell division protein FtsB [Halomonadaceae bacterium]|nr:MAG: cell division protein FtsB [Halomonadaceae bacterium]
MKALWIIMAVLIVLLQARLWAGEGSYAQVWQIQDQIDQQQAANAKLAARNEELFAEVANLSDGKRAIEERARTNLGMVRDGETFFLVVDSP